MRKIGGRPLVFGEVLFDCFPDGRAVMGGAPFNVAWHLQGFGLAPCLISRIGTDAEGEEVLSMMQAWGMDTQGVQRDGRHPTGRVQISMEGKAHSFDILPDQAYDFIDANVAATAAEQAQAGLIYYGSLINRNAVSASALKALLEQNVPAFVDINLRAPWWQADTVPTLFGRARWAKLNDEELIELFAGEAASSELAPLAERVRAQYGLELLILTCGAGGALLVKDQEVLRGEPVVVADLVDTVGAGDGFSAVCLLGLMQGWELGDILSRALEFAAQICRQQGATSQDRGLYSDFLRRWQL
jgi:fructokinase